MSNDVIFIAHKDCDTVSWSETPSLDCATYYKYLSERKEHIYICIKKDAPKGFKILLYVVGWDSIIETKKEEEAIRELFKELNPYLLDCLTFGVEPEPGIYGNVRPEV